MNRKRNIIRAAFFTFVLVSAVFFGVVCNVSAAQFFFDDMEPLPDPDWTADGMWHVTTDRAHSPTQSWVYNDGVDYDNGARNAGNLTSPVVDLSTAVFANLTFWTWYENEGGIDYDQMWIQISVNAGPFFNEYQINPTNMSTWYPISLNLTAYVGNNIEVRFFFDTIDDFANNYEGWYIDDVEINDVPIPPASTLFPPHEDSGLDTDGDSLYNFLIVNVTLNITVAGTYIIFGDLYDPFFMWLDDATNTTFLNVGIQVVQLQFEGFIIYQNGVDGSFTVDIELNDDSWNLLDTDSHMTNLYKFIEFDPPDALFEPPHSDYGEDTDSDTLFNFLVVNVTVNITVAGTYNIYGDLYSPTFNWIDDDTNTTFLSVGVQVVHLRFDGDLIYNNMEDGVFNVVLELYDDSWNLMDTDSHTTFFYGYKQFDPPLGWFEPPHSDFGEDTNSNFLYDFLVVNVTVNITVAGNYEIEGILLSPSFNPVGMDSNITFLNIGINIVQLRFMGGAIYGNGENGTFTVFLNLYDDMSNSLDNDWHTTFWYNYDEFDPPPASFWPPHSDYGLDTEPDGFYNFLVVNVTVNITVAGLYTIYGELLDQFSSWIDDDFNNTFLTVGIHTLQLLFDGTAIYLNGVNGTLNVDLLLFDDSMNQLDQDTYITIWYDYDQFQPPPSGPWATVTNPASPPSNNPNPIITYNYGNGPTSVEIYYSDDGGSTWNLWGTDPSVDGFWLPGGPLPASGIYFWCARAIGPPDEPVPSAAGDIEAGPYVLDIDAPTITSTTPNDGATGVSTSPGTYTIQFSEPMDMVGTPLTDLPGIVWTWDPSGMWLNGTYTALNPGTTYFVDLTGQGFQDPVTNPLTGDMYKNFTTLAGANPWAAATGPTSTSTNNPSPTITYNYGNGPTNVQIYWSDDGGSSWNMWGTDNTVDGSWPAATPLPASGSYNWSARAMGGPSEPAPSAPGDIEAGPYVLDIDAPYVQSTTPANADTGVALNQDIIITFNESMNPGSVDGTVEPNPGGISPGFNPGNTILTLAHNDFAPNTRYWVNVTMGTDLAGNDLVPLPYSFYFDTGAGVNTATASAPTGGPTNVGGINILYNTTGSPPTVDLYYTTDGTAPFTWTLIGTDNPADGTYPWTVPADGSYGWFAVSPAESAPLSSDPPEASFYIFDGTPPNVDNTVPANLDIGVFVNQDVIITFNETMVPGSVTYTIEPNPGGLTPGWSGSDTILTVSHTDFAQGTRYWVNITSGTDLAGNDLVPIPYSFYFDTAVGTTATAQGPISGPTNVAGVTLTYLTSGSPATTDLYYTTDTSSPYTWNFIVTDSPADGSFGWTIPSDGSYGWMAVSPDESAPISTDAPEASFYVYDGTQPKVLGTDPADLQPNIAINKVVVITFDEPMTTASVTYTVEPNPGGLSEGWSVGDTVISISHTDFSTSTKYWVNITAGTDLAGNNLNPLPYSFSFDTAATAAIATGPTSVGPTNVAGITITYNTVGAPLSVGLWFTTDTSAPYSWTNFGTDTPADGSMPWTVPADGDYGWIAQSPDEAAPGSGDSPEAFTYYYDGTPPEVSLTNPADMATGIAIIQPVVITFNETMIPGSVTYTVEPNPGGLAPSWALGDTQLTISHLDFAVGTRYWVNITAGTDLAGNNLNPLPYSFYFDTVTTATAQGPISGPTNIAGITITYVMAGNPATVDLYYTTDSGIPYTWTLAGTDNPADGSFGWSIPADGDYGWIAVSPHESAPISTDAPEASFYMYDGTPPEVSLTIPADMDVDVIATQPILITFNETMAPGSVTYTVEPDPGGLTTSWNIGNTTLTINHNDFAPGTRYWVNITAGTDLAGNNLNPLPFSFYFDTEIPDIVPPMVFSQNPTGVGVVINSLIIITFDEPMDKTSVENAFIMMPGALGTFSWNPANTTVTFTPSSNLAVATTYMVRLNGSIAMDMNGNTLDGNKNGTSEGSPDDDFTWQFTTEVPDNTPPTSSVSALPTYKTTLTFDITYTASDSGSGVKNVELWFKKDNGGWSKYNTYPGGSNTVTFTADSDGKYSFYTIATDNAGNPENPPSSEDASTIVDSTVPTVVSVELSDDSPVNAGLLTITITFSEDMKTAADPMVTFGLVMPYETNTLVKSAYSQDTWTGTFTITTSTGDGLNTLKIASAEDIAGNQMTDYTLQFTIDTKAPSVTSGGPTGSSVPVTTTITVTFNESMNKTTVQNAFSYTDGTTTWTAANGSFSWSGNTMTFTPDDDLEHDTEYTVTIGTSARDNADNAISEGYSWSFTTLELPDTTKPTVKNVSHSGENVEVSDKITITFSEPMNRTKVEESITISGGATIQSFSWAGNTLTITFTDDLEPGTQYTVTVGTGAEDEAGNSLSEPYTWSFSPKEKKEEPTDGNFLWLILLIIIIVVILLVFMLMKKRKPEEVPPDDQIPYPEEGQYPEEAPPGDENISENQDIPDDEPSSNQTDTEGAGDLIPDDEPQYSDGEKPE